MNEAVQTKDLLARFGVIDERPADCPTHGAYAEQQMRFAGRERWLGCPKCADEKAQREESERDAKLARERQENALRATMNQAAIPPRFQSRTLETYRADLPEQQKALAAATEYADTFTEALAQGRSMVFCGLPGTGKTHLAIGIAHRLIASGRTAVFTSAMNAIRRVRETYRRDADETERAAIQSFAKPDLLILDEVGQQLGTDAEKVTLFDIINARYEAMRPLIVISNLDLKGISEYLGERAFDRLREGGGRALNFTWESHRKSA